MALLSQQIQPSQAQPIGPQPAVGPGAWQPGQQPPPQQQQLSVDQLPILPMGQYPGGMSNGVSMGGQLPVQSQGVPASLASQVSMSRPSSPSKSSDGIQNGTTFLDPSVTHEDVLLGRVPVAHINLAQDTKGNYLDNNVANIAKTNPMLLQSIKDRQSMDYQNLLGQAQSQTTNQQDQANSINPMAVNLLWQNAVSPFLNGVVNSSRQQATNYGNLMNQLTDNPNLPSAYRDVLKTQVPQQMNDMNMITNANAANLVNKPGIDSLMGWLQQDYMTRRLSEAYLIAQSRLALGNQLNPQALAGASNSLGLNIGTPTGP